MNCELHTVISNFIDTKASDLHQISKKIWENPELCFEEFKAHELLTTFLEKEGFFVAKKTPLETSFIARYGNPDGLKVGICCEYDALPGIGHACGHNLIAEASVGAALGLKAALETSSDLKAEIIVFGTPAEEGGGGKVKMIEKGVFDEADICMMAHPTPYEIPHPIWLARTQLTVTFTGKASHAAAAPWEGINALDAAVACYNNISMLRQQIKPTCRVHCVITDGGEKPNIIPERSQLDCYMRGITDEDTFSLKKKVEDCARGAAISTGCTVDLKTDDPFYSAVKTNETLINLYVSHAKRLGVQFNDDEYRTKVLASTDMGNVSQIKPSIHPLFKIKTEHANHTHGFTSATGADENQLPTLNSAKCMAMAAVDVIVKPSLMEEIKKDFCKL